MAKVVEDVARVRKEPPQGAGGLGIISQAINNSQLYYGDRLGFGLISMSLLFKNRRMQCIGSDNRQSIGINPVDPSTSSQYSFLGNLVTVRIAGEDFHPQVWMYEGYKEGEEYTPALCMHAPDFTDTIYPHSTSTELFNQMQILGQGGFKLAQHFGLLGTDFFRESFQPRCDWTR